MHLHSLIAFTIALAIAVAAPGPAIISVVSCALARGFREAAAMTCGFILGDLTFFTLAVFGMAALAHSMGDLFLVVKLAGAGYVIWLGVKLWRATPVAVDPAPGKTGDKAMGRGFWRNLTAGLSLTLGNPKPIAFYAGLLPTFVDLQALTLQDGLAMAGILVIVVGAIPCAYALAAARARRLLTDPRRVRLVNRSAGTMMIGAGIAVATQ